MPVQNLTLAGANQFDKQYPTGLQFQPVVLANNEYYMYWMGGSAPATVDLSIYNLNQLVVYSNYFVGVILTE